MLAFLFFALKQGTNLSHFLGFQKSQATGAQQCQGVAQCAQQCIDQHGSEWSACCDINPHGPPTCYCCFDPDGNLSGCPGGHCCVRTASTCTDFADCCPASSPEPSPSSSPTPSPTPSSNKITFSGELGFAADNGAVAACSVNDLKSLAGTTISVYDNSNSNRLGATTATFDAASNKPKYSITVNKASNGQYKMVATKTDYYDSPDAFTATSDTTKNIRMKPKSVAIKGRVIDEQDGFGIPNIWVQKYEDVHTTSNKDGSYSLKIATGFSDYTIMLDAIPSETSAYNDRLAIPNIPVTCLNNYADITLAKTKICEKPGGRNVEICWWGDRAKSLHDDITYQSYWLELADLTEQLRTKVGYSSIPRRLNIISNTAAIAWENPHNRDITFSQQWITQNDWTGVDDFRLFKLTFLPHEFGHAFQDTHENLTPTFDTLLTEGSNLKKSNPSYTDTTVYKILTPEWEYYIGEYGYEDMAGGYAGTDSWELFAETFCTMFTFDTKMHAKIADMTFPADLRAYAKKCHNAAAAAFPHGNTIAWEKIKQFLATNLN